MPSDDMAGVLAVGSADGIVAELVLGTVLLAVAVPAPTVLAAAELIPALLGAAGPMVLALAGDALPLLLAADEVAAPGRA